ncbi:MAG: flavin reductase family protein [Pseudacidovorax sp.]|uniref:flavin reductase family protein n=1 Tax=Pseudacidovorax sp. TaxID=1934311 RepID=UPI001B4EA426|nr:flavin reductase family protein [Pseudacidovorax sp.]MBP6897491.1 flavin reductase family protein [Pseudacidovorax sp.]
MNDHEEVAAGGLDTATAYRLICGIVVPRPVAWITTVDRDGRVNAAPFSSYNYVAHSPPMVAVNIGTRQGTLKDTARNIRDSGFFCVNVATEEVMETLHQCGADYPPEVGEPEALGIALLPGVHTPVPRIAASPIHMECRLDQFVTLGRGLNTLYIGEVLSFHLSRTVYDGRNVDSQRLRPIARLGGPYYAALGQTFHRPALQRPPGEPAGDTP